MTEETVMNLAAGAIRTTIYLAGPLLIAAMVIGILVSVLQAITQINESTLTFIPKLIAVIIVMVVMGPWMLQMMQNYAVQIFTNFGALLH